MDMTLHCNFERYVGLVANQIKVAPFLVKLEGGKLKSGPRKYISAISNKVIKYMCLAPKNLSDHSFLNYLESWEDQSL